MTLDCCQSPVEAVVRSSMASYDEPTLVDESETTLPELPTSFVDETFQASLPLPLPLPKRRPSSKGALKLKLNITKWTGFVGKGHTRRHMDLLAFVPAPTPYIYPGPGA